MHWVKATAPDGTPAYINLDAVPVMQSGMLEDRPVTVLFLGGVAAKIDGSLVYAKTLVVESIPEIFLLPRIMASPICKTLTTDAARASAVHATPAPGAPSKGAATTARVPNVEEEDGFPTDAYRPDVPVTRTNVPLQTFPDPGSTPTAKSRDRFKSAKASRRAKR
jgi:hypothetical protein